MPIGDYLTDASLGSVIVATGFRARLRSWWDRLFHRGTVEGHKFEAYK